MKKTMIACVLTTALFSGAALAGNDNIVTVIDSSITQVQEGLELTQEAVIGSIHKGAKGHNSVLVVGSDVVQVQSGLGNTQEARIGTVGCDC